MIAVVALGLAGLAAVQAHQANRALDAQRATGRTLRADLARTRRRQAQSDKTISGLGDRIAKLEAASRSRPSTTALATKAEQSVFTVQTSAGLGTGWVISSTDTESVLVTNRHVVEPLGVGDTVKIKQDDLTFEASITLVARGADLALLRVDQAFAPLPTTVKEPPVGSSVIIVGSPLGLGGSVTTGVVSAYRRQRSVRYLQFSAPISPGNSGGPVLDDQGRVIGVAVAKLVDEAAEGLGFAIPAKTLCAETRACST